VSGRDVARILGLGVLISAEVKANKI